MSPALFLLVACGADLIRDTDADGYIDALDCQPYNPSVNPSANDATGDGVDQNCDGVDGTDVDGDGQASVESGGEDCNDWDPLAYTGAYETCEDRIVSDCALTIREASALCWGDLSLAEAHFRVYGEMPSEEIGVSVAGAGDVNGDGFNDLILGSWGDTPNGPWSGSSHVVYGPLTGSADISATSDARLEGEAEGDFAGHRVAGTGDFNGDGFDDVLVGAHDNDEGGAHAGAAYLILGPVSGTMGLADAPLKLLGERAGAWAGWAVAPAGDVNDDGYQDILVGATATASEADGLGAVHLILGQELSTDEVRSLSEADATLRGVTWNDATGVSTTGGGDLNGDGLDDLLVGANEVLPGGPGVVYAVMSPVYGDFDLRDADATLRGESPYDTVGESVASAGDVDGDGNADVLIGAPQGVDPHLGPGRAYLVLGPLWGERPLDTADAVLVGEAYGDRAGYSVAAAGDVNGDQHADLLVGTYQALRADDPPGLAYLVLGPVSGHVDLGEADGRLVGESTHGRAGFSVASAGDVNGDGLDDLLIGAIGEREFAGAAYVFHGRSY
ncbi:MAG: FG-GAP repeat protein [Alphaproteobacteria bacterium]|nr:FG-GAP repeat protein [Alphaproteobacteria bacterium]